ncbi:low molecular weight phosphatase family protein [Rudaeicoccus suwonensis]|uniref:Protein-tyrosine phosphatase n=1 Tax=Rudaeicoccus suwonensis TaxID=657409 RepID=A0A561E8S8_9MICO|nr:low molecular weight phosphatase family protein [Rudaeicoccus suwonensis]TWE12024.1 protein-tyrosine phosphatase [Rudaeicoccus suwonensis]
MTQQSTAGPGGQSSTGRMPLGQIFGQTAAAPQPAAAARSGRILIVCTGNICRSPFIERLLAHHLIGVDVEVTSAGTRALVGEPMQPPSEQLLGERGVGPAGFRATQLTEHLATAADIVLTATREHRSQVVQLAPAALKRTFAIADFADLCAALPAPPWPLRPMERTDDPPLRRLVGQLAAIRPQVAPRQADDADIPDPFRQEFAVYEQMAQQVDGFVPSTVAAIQAALTAGPPLR